jgi:phage tail-like protein
VSAASSSSVQRLVRRPAPNDSLVLPVASTAVAARGLGRAPVSDSNFDSHSATVSTFLFEVDGEEIGRFTEVSGLEMSIAVEEIEEGGTNDFVHKLPGRMSWPNLVLKRGLTETDNLYAWMQKSAGEKFESAGNKLERSTAALTLLSAGGDRLRSWDFEGAFPVKWTGPSFSLASDDLAVEELEIAHHGFRASDY